MEPCIKMVNRSATSAFAPDGVYMVAGTTAGAVDMQFSSSANLDIFELHFAADDRELILVGTTPSSERFNRLSWGKGPTNSEEFSLGIIAGGLVDGNIKLWNPKTLIGSHPSKKDTDRSESGFLGQLSRDKGPVRGLEFNSLSPELLASGADEGEICIWDVTKPSEPSHFPPLKGSGSAAQGEISFLSWNRKVQHILASTSFNGTTAIWDLRKQKPVISFKDSVRRRCSVLQWNPDVSPQLVVASDEDSSPSLRLWDMRNIMSPVKEFAGHTKGVIAMSWCPIDSSYLLTCAKDNRTICWDTISGEIVAELPAGTYWNFDVHWYTKIPGVISASSFDGKIGIYNIQGCGQYGIGKSDISAGKLVSFHSADSQAVSSEVYVHNLVKEQRLASRSSEFEASVRNRDRSALRLLCDKKSHESESEQERETWDFIKVMFNEDGTARSDLLSHLGFSLPAERKSTLQNDFSEPKEIFCGNKDTTLVTMDSGEEFFNNLPSPMADTPLSTSFNEFVAGDSINYPQPEMDGPEDSSGPSFDDSVQQALVVGDYKGAVAKCISTNRWADALVIAHVGGSSLWEFTRDQYLKTRHSSYLKVVSAVVNNDLMSIAKSRPLKSWKETLALFCTFAQKDEWTQLCDSLATRLFSAGNVAVATLCYICAGNIDETVEIWSKNLRDKHGEKSYMDNLQDLMEKTMLFALATEHKKFSASLCKLVEKYAEILASQGLLTAAMEYLKLLGTEELPLELTILRDLIALSTERDKEIEKSTTYENYQLQTGPSFSADQSSYGAINACQHYYHETSSQTEPSVPKSPYADGYQRSLNTQFTNGYNALSTYQPAPQPNMQQPTTFFPSQASQASVENFHPPPLHNQPTTITSFVPVDAPVLRNVEQYEQPSLGSQPYPQASNTSYQTAPHGVAAYGLNTSNVGQTMPQGLVTAPVSGGFMPINSSGVQRPRSPTRQAPIQPPAPAAPPTVQTVDTSNVPAQQKPVISTLTRLFNETSAALGGPRANPAKKREMDDNSKKLGALFAKLHSGDVSKNAAEKLIQLCHALDKGDFSTALQIQVLLTTTDWDECNFWLSALKRMIKTRQNLR